MQLALSLAPRSCLLLSSLALLSLSLSTPPSVVVGLARLLVLPLSIEHPLVRLLFSTCKEMGFSLHQMGFKVNMVTGWES